MVPIDRRKKLLVYLAMCSVFVDNLGNTGMRPILPALVYRFNKTEAELSFILASYPFAQMVSSPVAGALSDHVGRIPLLMISLAGTSACFLIVFAATSWHFLMLAYALAGVFGNSQSICSALISDIIPEESLAKFYSLLGSFLQFSYIAGPAIGGLLVVISLEAPFLAISAFGAVVLLLLIITARKDIVRPHTHASSDVSATQSASKSITQGGNQRPKKLESKAMVVHFLVVVMCMWMTLSAWSSMGIVYAYDRLGWGPTEFGAASAIVNLIVILYQVRVMPRLLKRFSPTRCYASALVGLSLAMATLASVSWVAQLHYIVFPLFNFAYLLLNFSAHTCMSCATMILMMQYATPQTRGLLAGLMNTVRMVNQSFAPLAYLKMFQLGHVDKAWLFSSGMAAVSFVVFVFGPSRGCERKVNSATHAS